MKKLKYLPLFCSVMLASSVCANPSFLLSYKKKRLHTPNVYNVTMQYGYRIYAIPLTLVEEKDLQYKDGTPTYHDRFMNTPLLEKVESIKLASETINLDSRFNPIYMVAAIYTVSFTHEEMSFECGSPIKPIPLSLIPNKPIEVTMTFGTAHVFIKPFGKGKITLDCKVKDTSNHKNIEVIGNDDL